MNDQIDPIDERWYDGKKVTKAELAAEITNLRTQLDRFYGWWDLPYPRPALREYVRSGNK